MVPFQIQDRFWETPLFWVGLFFVTFPLNFLVYGLNDFNDVYADALNPRKGNFLFGAKFSSAKLSHVPNAITWVVGPFMVFFSWIAGWKMFGLLLFMVAINIVYNFRPFRLKERPPFEICIQVGYVLVAFFSTWLNGMPSIPWQTIVYLSLFAFQAHIAGEIMDLEPDYLVGKKTTATLIGRKKTKILMLILLLIETYILYSWFRDMVLAGFLALFAVWLIIDVFFVFKEKPYTLSQMKLFGWAMNAIAIVSMIWVLYSGKLMHPVF